MHIGNTNLLLPMIGKSRQLVRDETVEFEKKPVQVQEFRKLPITLEEIYGIQLKLIKEIRRMSTCNRLDLQTLGSQPIML